MGIIYKVTNKTNGKIYIGQTKNGLEKRKLGHENAAIYKNSSLFFHRALRKYGIDNFVWEIVEECENELLTEREIYYIELYKSNTRLFPDLGYNMTNGGDGGYVNEFNPNKADIYRRIGLSNSGENNYLRKMSLDEREQFLDAHRRGENNPMFGRVKTVEERNAQSIRMKNNPPMKGKKHTDETKRKMSISGKGKITGEKNPNYGKKGESSHVSKKYVITLKCGYEFFVHGIDEFCDWYKCEFGIILQPQNISIVAKGKNKHHKGLLVRFYDLEKDNDVKYWKDVLETIKEQNKNA